MHNYRAYVAFLQKIEEPFRNFLIPSEKLRLELRKSAGTDVSATAPVIKSLHDFSQELTKIKVPVYFELCVHSQKAGKGWIEDVNKRKLLIKIIDHRTKEALNQIDIAPSMVASQPKLIEALFAFSLLSKLGNKLEEYKPWNNMVSSLMIEAMTL